MLKLTSFVLPQAIVPQIKSVDRDAVIAELVDAVIAAGAAPSSIRSELLGRVLDREKRGSTGFGKGVAVPHVKHKQIAKMTAAIGVSARGIEFNALDKQPVFSVVLLLSPEDRPEEHLQAMEVIFKNLSKDTFRRLLKQATTVEHVRTLLEESDGNHLAG